jgi:hypothetical protein
MTSLSSMLHVKYLSKSGRKLIGKMSSLARSQAPDPGDALGLKKMGKSWGDRSQHWGLPRVSIQRLVNDYEEEVPLGPLQKRGRKFHLPNQVSLELISRAIQRRRVKDPVDLRWTCDVVQELTDGDWRPSESWASKFWAKLGWRSRKAQLQSKKEADASVLPDTQKFVAGINEEIQGFQIPPQQVWTTDETAVWNGAPCLRTLVDPETNDATVIVRGDMSRDTLMVAVNQA